LLGISQGGAIAAAYTARHPGRVSRLVMYGAYARGRAKRGDSADELEAMVTLTRAGWGRDDPAYRQMFTSRFMPGATIEQMGWFNDLQRISTSGDNAAAVLSEISQIDVLPILNRIQTPTLVLHARGDVQVPFEQGRQLAGLIPGARFVALEGNNHLLLESEPAWQVALKEVRAFLVLSMLRLNEVSSRLVPPQIAIGVFAGGMLAFIGKTAHLASADLVVFAPALG